MKTIRMSKEQHEKWDAALRSGEYKQATGALFRDDDSGGIGYCCLGVLEHCLTGEVEDRGLPSPDWLTENGIKFSTLSGRSSLHPSVNYNGYEVDSIADLNDKGIPFTTIADAIATHVEYTDQEQP